MSIQLILFIAIVFYTINKSHCNSIICNEQMLHLINSLDRVSSFSDGQMNINQAISVTKPTHLEYAGTVPTPSSATPMILRPDCIKQLQVEHNYTKQDLLVTISKQLKTHHSFNVLISLFIHLLSPDDQGVRCSSMVRAFAHEAMCHRIDCSWSTH